MESLILVFKIEFDFLFLEIPQAFLIEFRKVDDRFSKPFHLLIVYQIQHPKFLSLVCINFFRHSFKNQSLSK